MTTTSEEFHADAEFLRGVVDDNIVDPKIAERLRRIADHVEMMSHAMFDPGQQLEQRAEAELSRIVRKTLDQRDNDVWNGDTSLIALWLIERRLASAGSKSLLGGGLSALGLLGSIASAVGAKTGTAKG